MVYRKEESYQTNCCVRGWRAPWVLRSTAHAGPVEAQNMPRTVLPGGRWFLSKICGEGQRPPPRRDVEKWYKISDDWEAKLYCGITLNWNYDSNDRWLDISMPMPTWTR